MNNAWVTKADVLKDLYLVNGKNTSAAELEHYVVRGEMPPPARQEMDDDDAMQYHFGPVGAAPGDDRHVPDLQGISRMLQLVDDLDESTDCADTKTIYRNKQNDEFCISKLNPNVNDFVPGRRKEFKIEPDLEIPKPVVQLTFQTKINQKGPQLIRKSDKKTNRIKENCHSNGQMTTGETVRVQLNDSQAVIPKNISTSSVSDIPKIDKRCEPTQARSDDISLDKKLDISTMKSEEIALMKEKVKSKIINSKDNSLQNKKQKNVAIATLLKLCTVPPATTESEPVKLITPEYFQEPPVLDKVDTKVEFVEKDIDVIKEQIEQTAINTKVTQKYVDPLVEESISKVNDWFNNTGAPKIRPPAVDPIKKPIAFKKKDTSSQSISTSKSITNSEKKDSCGEFVPSTYASDLLQRYESNAKKQLPPKEDLGSMLERQLKERDQIIKKKLLEKKTAASPDTGRSVQ